MYESENKGGIIINKYDFNFESFEYTLGSDPYEYKIIKLKKNEAKIINGLKKYCIFILKSKNSVEINGVLVEENKFLLAEKETLKVISSSEGSLILLACQEIDIINECEYINKEVNEAKIVNKPWGREIWLTEDPAKVFAFKKICLNKGQKTSLQYHEYKRETNFLYEGKLKLHFVLKKEYDLKAFKAEILDVKTIKKGTVIDIYPRKIHRLEAITDCILYEISTTELDDVIRLQDETGRMNGRVNREHE
jgi:quercetin dioxygenase-like cupin family protein